ncbi:NmrA family NAD(P)-binding protein [Paenibacillus prosopidis]|uniref:NAD(P)H dehydrogenase (Quinone) n=1 Tax=Paenibacillus prosopidis TaxID=630520 RepID=A0A368W2A5_9BACL|nr:NmrA family NAD(P)-binding protein [Paenibacillus prosopidis]RCW47955.1 NAD(P)H dehydrogenase (quinone) [Paenibacillus prosopidis]
MSIQPSANEIVAVVRNAEKASALADLGVELRHGDYNDRASLEKAFARASRLLFIPSPDAHDETLRILQHANVAKAAKDANARHIIYYGYAFRETSQLPLTSTHVITERIIRTTNIPFTFLRNPLYTDVFVNPQSVGAAVQFVALVANAGEGGVHTASRHDLALAGAAVLTEDGHELGQLAQTIANVSGKEVVYKSISFDEHKALLVQAGLPEGVAVMMSAIYQSVAEGETSKTSDDLINLIGTLIPLEEVVKQSLQG